MNNGILFLFLAGLFWSSGGVFLKFVNCDSFTTAGIRSFFALLTMTVLMRRFPKFTVKTESRKIDLKNTIYMWLGGIFYSLTMILFVFANKYTTAANAVLLQYTSPIYVIFLSPLLLKEKNSKADLIAVTGVIFGMILFFAEGLETGNIFGNLLAIGSGICYSMLPIFMRKGTVNYSKDVFLLSHLITAAASIPFFIISIKPDPVSWVFLFLLGFIQIGIPSLLYSAGVSKVRALTAALIVMIGINFIFEFLINLLLSNTIYNIIRIKKNK